MFSKKCTKCILLQYVCLIGSPLLLSAGATGLHRTTEETRVETLAHNVTAGARYYDGTDCHWRSDASAGNLTSPGYPRLPAVFIHCDWVVVGHLGARVELTLSTDLPRPEADGFCTHSMLSYGTFDHVGRRVTAKELCGRSATQRYTVISHWVWLRLLYSPTTSDLNRHKGVFVSYRVVPTPVIELEYVVGLLCAIIIPFLCCVPAVAYYCKQKRASEDRDIHTALTKWQEKDFVKEMLKQFELDKQRRRSEDMSRQVLQTTLTLERLGVAWQENTQSLEVAPGNHPVSPRPLMGIPMKTLVPRQQAVSVQAVASGIDLDPNESLQQPVQDQGETSDLLSVKPRTESVDSVRRAFLQISGKLPSSTPLPQVMINDFPWMAGNTVDEVPTVTERRRSSISRPPTLESISEMPHENSDSTDTTTMSLRELEEKAAGKRSGNEVYPLPPEPSRKMTFTLGKQPIALQQNAEIEMEGADTVATSSAASLRNLESSELVSLSKLDNDVFTTASPLPSPTSLKKGLRRSIGQNVDTGSYDLASTESEQDGTPDATADDSDGLYEPTSGNRDLNDAVLIQSAEGAFEEGLASRASRKDGTGASSGPSHAYEVATGSDRASDTENARYGSQENLAFVDSGQEVDYKDLRQYYDEINEMSARLSNTSESTEDLEGDITKAEARRYMLHAFQRALGDIDQPHPTRRQAWPDNKPVQTMAYDGACRETVV